jgi:hypothetical protein
VPSIPKNGCDVPPYIKETMRPNALKYSPLHNLTLAS